MYAQQFTGVPMYACPTVLMFEHFHVSPLRAMMYRRVCNVCVRVCVCASYARAARVLCGRRSPLEFKIAPPGYARAGRARCNRASESGGDEPRRRSRMLAKGVKRALIHISEPTRAY